MRDRSSLPTRAATGGPGIAVLLVVLLLSSMFAALTTGATGGSMDTHADDASPLARSASALVTGAQGAVSDAHLGSVPHDPWQDPGLHPMQALIQRGGACAQAHCPGSEAWVQWTEAVALQALIESARFHVDEAGMPGLPAPDAFPGHDEAPEPVVRSAWRVWWLLSLAPHELIGDDAGLATQGGVALGPRWGPDTTDAVVLDARDGRDGPVMQDLFWDGVSTGSKPVASLMSPGGLPGLMQSGLTPGDGNGQNVSVVEEDAALGDFTPFGEPRHLEEIWRLNAHGRPQGLLPVDDQGAHLVVTDQAVFYRDGPDAEPDWLRRLDFPVQAGRVTADGSLFVLGSMQLFDFNAPSIRVFDVATGQRVYEGLPGEGSLVEWVLTDVDGDGQDDLVGLSFDGQLVALKLDGDELYRKEMPTPGVHVPALDVYLAISGYNQGIQFGDATGDGTLDLFVLAMVNELMFSGIAVTLVSGQTGEVVWSVLVDPWDDSWFAQAATTGDLTGDGLADFFFQDYRFMDTGQALATKGVAGLDGQVILRDSGGPGCIEPVLGCDDTPYFPVAVADVTGDGQAELVGFSQMGPNAFPGYELNGLEVRSPGPIPGAHSSLLEREAFGFSFYLGFSSLLFSHYTPDLWVWQEGDAATVEVFFAPYLVRYSDGSGFNTESLLFRVQDAAVKEVSLPEDMMLFARHAGSGAAYGWSVKDDRFVRLAEDGSRVDEGLLLIVSSVPWLFQDVDGDQVPDALLIAGSGYRWVSGKNGTLIDEVLRPDDVTALRVLQYQGTPWVVERHGDDELVLWDLMRDREGGSVELTGLDQGYFVMDLWDYTGDGEFELLVREYDHWDFSDGVLQPRREPGQFMLMAMESGEVLWEESSEDLQVVPAPLLGRESTRQLLLVDRSGDEDQLTAWSPASEAPLWERTLEDNERLAAVGMGLLALLGPSEEDEDDVLEVRVLRGESGSGVHTHTIEDPDQVTPIRFMDLGGASDRLVVGHTAARENMPEAQKHVIEVVDWRLGRIQGAFEVTPPLIERHTIEGDGFTMSLSAHRYTRLGPSVGDWTGDGVHELVFSEYKGAWHGVVRSATDGEPVAVGSDRGGFVDAVDFNGDGRKEVVQAQNGLLRLLAYDQTRTSGPEDDEGVSSFSQQQTDRDNRTAAFFDQERESPGVALVVLLGVLVALVVAMRRDGAAPRRR